MLASNFELKIVEPATLSVLRRLTSIQGQLRVLVAALANASPFPMPVD